MKNKIKELRINIDALSQLIDHLQPIEKSKIVWDEVNTNAIKNKIWNEKSKELTKSYDSLILAKAWLGKVLESLGEETSYKNSGKRKDINDIEEASDVAIVVAGLRKPFTDRPDRSKKVAVAKDTWELNGRSMSDYSNMNHIEKIYWLRKEIKNIINDTPIRDLCNMGYELRVQIAITHLSEARFWLERELQRIKKDN